MFGINKDAVGGKKSVKGTLFDFSSAVFIGLCFFLPVASAVNKKDRRLQRLRLFITRAYSGETCKQPKGRTTYGRFIMLDLGRASWKRLHSFCKYI